jgi:hypothetical protein
LKFEEEDGANPTVFDLVPMKHATEMKELPAAT